MRALGLIETKGLIAAIESADAMLKAADVTLLEKTYVGGGLVTIAVAGDVGSVKAAIEAGGAAVRIIDKSLLISQHIIPRPHQELDIIMSSTALNIEKAEFEEHTEEVLTEAEKTITSFSMDLSELHNKEDVDTMMLKFDLEEVIEALSKLKVIELRNLARGYKEFGIAGRAVSKANKKLLLIEFRKYYGNK